MEASGTSGMKASLNGGVLNLSIMDGWWIEGYNGGNGWAFGGETAADCEARDGVDAAAIYDLLENEVVPLYYDRSIDGIPHGWVTMMKESIKSNGPPVLIPQDGKGVRRPVLSVAPEGCGGGIRPNPPGDGETPPAIAGLEPAGAGNGSGRSLLP